MAEFNKKGAAGGAASGAAAGTAIAPGWGTAAGAVVGGLAGGFMGGSKKYQSPHYSDIDLQRENPGLWAQLQSLNAMADQAEYAYKMKAQNDAAIQAREVGQGMTQLQDRLANAGLLGTSAGLSTSVDAEANLRAQIAQKAYMEQEQARQSAAALRTNYINQYSAAQKGIFAPMEAEAQANWANANAEAQAENQFMMSGLSSLAGAYGQHRNQELMTQQRQDDRDFYQNLYSPNRSPASSYSGPTGYQVYGGIPMGTPQGSTGVQAYGGPLYPGGTNYPSRGGY